MIEETETEAKRGELRPIERVLIWLSGSDANLLHEECPRWEKVKYEAFGASVLVPVAFGMIASCYAVNTLTDNWFIILGFSLVWGFIILTIDRVLLSTYRAFATASKKLTQFILRLTVAILMGLTVSHPLTLLVFKDTIASEIERKRDVELRDIREAADAEKQELEARILAATETLAEQQMKYQDTASGKFVTTRSEPVVKSDPGESFHFKDIDGRIEAFKKERDQVRQDLEKWQETYDEEIRGVRSGRAGIGPNARAIERDHLVWRREEVERLSGVIRELYDERSRLSEEVFTKQAASEAALEETRREFEKQSLKMVAGQQGQMLEILKGQIDSASKEVDRLRADAAMLTENTRKRIQGIMDERRSDLMVQTLVLHEIFKKSDGSGHFALMVYIILVGLFTLIDTIPLVVKFFSLPGPYDMLVHYRDTCKLPMGMEVDPDFMKRMTQRANISHNLSTYEPIKMPPPPEPVLPEYHEEPDPGPMDGPGGGTPLPSSPTGSQLELAAGQVGVHTNLVPVHQVADTYAPVQQAVADIPQPVDHVAPEVCSISVSSGETPVQRGGEGLLRHTVQDLSWSREDSIEGMIFASPRQETEKSVPVKRKRESRTPAQEIRPVVNHPIDSNPEFGPGFGESIGIVDALKSKQKARRLGGIPFLFRKAV